MNGAVQGAMLLRVCMWANGQATLHNVNDLKIVVHPNHLEAYKPYQQRAVMNGHDGPDLKFVRGGGMVNRT